MLDYQLLIIESKFVYDNLAIASHLCKSVVNCHIYNGRNLKELKIPVFAGKIYSY